MTHQKVFTHFEPPGYTRPVGTYSWGIKVKPGASFIFLSGLAPLDDDGKGLVGFDICTQTSRVIERMRKVLEEAGAALDDVVRIRVLLADIKDREGFNDTADTYWEKAPTVNLELLSVLNLPGQLIEIDAMAAV